MMRLTHYSTVLTITALALGYAAHVAAQTLPTGAAVASGTAVVSAHGARKIAIDQRSDRAVINWSSFSLSRDARVDVSQPSASSILLNRVTGPQASQIDGTLTANGRVWIVNPQGVYFGAGSSVQVGALLASSLSITDDDFNAGRFRFALSGAPAPVQLDGSVQVTTGTGSVVAIAPTVTQGAQGTIHAPGGQVQLIAHDQVELQLDASGLITARLGLASTQSILNTEGRITVDNGMVLLSAQGSAHAGTALLKLSGIIDAGTVTTRGGRVFLESTGELELTGRIVAEGAGGSVQVRSSDGGIPAGSNGSIAVPSADRLLTSVSFTAPPGALTARGAALAPDGSGQYELAAAKAATEESGKLARKASGNSREEATTEQSILALDADPAVQQANAAMPASSPGQSADSSSGITGVIGNQGNDKLVGNAGGAGGGHPGGPSKPGGLTVPDTPATPITPVPPVAVIDPPTTPVPPTAPIPPVAIDTPVAPVPPTPPVTPVAVIDPPTTPVPPTRPVSPVAIDTPVTPAPPAPPVTPVAVIDPPNTPVPPTAPIQPVAMAEPTSTAPSGSTAVLSSPTVAQAAAGNSQTLLATPPYRGLPQSAFALYDLRAGKPAWLGNFRAQIDADQIVLSASRSKSTPAAVYVPADRAGVRFDLPAPGAQSLQYIARRQGNGVVIAALDPASAFALDAQGKAIAANGLVALAQQRGTDLGLVRSVSLAGVGQ